MDIEWVKSRCPFCDKFIFSYWMKGGGGLVSDSNYTLWADWVCHPACVTKSIDKYYRTKELEMASKFGRLGSILSVLTKTKSYELATELAFKKIGKKIEANSENPEIVKEIAKEMIKGAPDLVTAIVAGTEAEK